MKHGEAHFKLIRHLRSPIVDASEDPFSCPMALKVKPNQILWFKEKTLKSILYDEVDEKQVLGLFQLLADGGVLISDKISDEAVKAVRRAFRYQIYKEGPFTIMKRLSGSAGEYPATKSKAVDGRKKVLLIRYGANGDHLMVTPLIQYYHDEGWYVAYNVTEQGEVIFKDDPRIDDLIVQETDTVSRLRIHMQAYWDQLGKDYDKVVSLSETVEGHLLRIEGTPKYNDSWEKRNIECNKNYLDYHFERAGLDIKGRLPAVWLSDKEKEWAKQEIEHVRKKLGKKFIVLWNIFGSSWHKAYPWMFDVWMILKTNRDDIGVLAVSDELGEYVVGGEFTGTVYNGCNKYKFRQSLALHSAVDAVVTPETWSLTAALAFPAPMIALLSHSSPDNFTSREQDVYLQASVKDCPCIPCHQLHYSKISCPRGVFNKDATLCMDQIQPGTVYDELIKLRSRHGDHVIAA